MKPVNGSSLADGGARILIVDDDPRIREVLTRWLVDSGFLVDQAASAAQALGALLSAPPDLVLLDVHLAEDKGHDVLRAIRARPALRLLPVIMITGAATWSEKLEAIDEGVTDFLPKPLHLQELSYRIRALLRLKSYTDALEEAERVMLGLARTIDARDAYTGGHSERVAEYAVRLAERIGLSPRDQEAARLGGLFHDFGKVGVSDAILRKPGKLTTQEFDEIKRHPAKGRELLGPMKSLAGALPAVYHHHERMDGSGYPEGLMGESVPLVARVVTVADIYDALTTDRPYRPALEHTRALGIMDDEARRGWWDRRLVTEFGLLFYQRNGHVLLHPHVTASDPPPKREAA
jgi:putative two-component system response regulator